MNHRRGSPPVLPAWLLTDTSHEPSDQPFTYTQEIKHLRYTGTDTGPAEAVSSMYTDSPSLLGELQRARPGNSRIPTLPLYTASLTLVRAQSFLYSSPEALNMSVSWSHFLYDPG